VFLSYHGSHDRAAVERIARNLQMSRVRPWFDQWHTIPGGSWQEEISAALRSSSACAVFLGAHGLGPWEKQELQVALDRATKDPGFRVFLVLLPGTEDPFDPTELAPWLTTKTWVDLRRGVEDRKGYQQLLNAIRGVAPGPDVVDLGQVEEACPYRGLQPFDAEHAEFFFGREADVQRLVERLKVGGFLAVLGPSGSGKSSLVRAGLVPGLTRGALPGVTDAVISILRPGPHPLTTLSSHLVQLASDRPMQATLDGVSSDPRTLELATSLALTDQSAERRVFWVIDQFEEVFTLCRDEAERAMFIGNLLHAGTVPDGHSYVILTLRADYYPRCAAHPEFAAVIASHQYLVSRLSGDGLRDAIVQPALRVGLEFERGLTDTILADAGNEPGSLPLLQHALLELWERRRGHMLTLEGYRETGGVRGALAKTADEIYSAFSPPEQSIARRVLLRLTQPGEGTDDTRRRADMDELVTGPEDVEPVESVVEALAAQRLLTATLDESTERRVVDISHEALVRGWPMLRGWIEDDRAGLLVHRRLTAAALEWQRLQFEDGALYRGARLAEAIEWRSGNELAMNALERRFLDACLELQTRERDEADRRRERELQDSKRIASAQRRAVRRLAGVVIVLLLGLLGSGTAAFIAVHQAKRADAEKQTAKSRQVAASALVLQDIDPELSILLATKAVQLKPTESAQWVLRDVVARSNLRGAAQLVQGTATAATVEAWAGVAVVSSTQGTSIFDLETGKEIISLTGGKDATAVALDPTGHWVAAGDQAGNVWVWSRTTGEEGGQFHVPTRVTDIAFGPDGVALAAATDQGVLLWPSWADGGVPKPFDPGPVQSIDFDPSGHRLIAGDARGMADVWDLGEAFDRPRQARTLQGQRLLLWDVTFSADGTKVVTTSGDNTAWVRDAADRRSDLSLIGHTGGVLTGRFSADGTRVVTTSLDGTARVWSISGGEPVVLRGHRGAVLSADFSADGTMVTTVGADGWLRRWQVKTGIVALTSPEGHTGPVGDVAFTPDGRDVITGSKDTSAAIWAVDTGRNVEFLNWHGAPVVGVATSMDGRFLATASIDGSSEIWGGGGESGTWTPLHSLVEEAGMPNAIAFRPDGTIVATASTGGGVCLWNTDSGEPVRCLPIGDPVKDVLFTPDGHLMITAAGRTVRMWDTATWQQSGALPASPAAVTSISVTEDGRDLAVGSEDGSVRFWDVVSRRPTRPLPTTRGLVMDVAFDPSGNFLAVARRRSGVEVWAVESRTLAARLPRREAQTLAVAFSTHGLLVTADSDGKARIYSPEYYLPIDAVLDIAPTRVTRDLTDREIERYLG